MRDDLRVSEAHTRALVERSALMHDLWKAARLEVATLRAVVRLAEVWHEQACLDCAFADHTDCCPDDPWTTGCEFAQALAALDEEERA